MEILVGKNAGFCYGVKRAVEGAEDVLEKEKKNIYCLGEIVHNKDVIMDLENKGIKVIDNIDDADNIAIIRAHGVAKDVYETAQRKGITLIDFTCPKVLKIHEIAEEYSQKGYFIILTGTPQHPENIGTISFCGDNKYIIENIEDVEKAIDEINKTNINKGLLISQTTYSVEKFEIIQNKLKELLPKEVEFVVKNTICATTKNRQEEVVQIAKSVECMIIIGGKNSSNTKKLFEVSKKYCDNCICIENIKELDIETVVKFKKIGIMAGASTPQKSIEDVINKLKTYE